MKQVFAAFALVLMAACTGPIEEELAAVPEPIGDFRKGFTVVVAPNLVQGPISRAATDEEWIAAVTAAVDERFDRFEGGQYFHIALSVEGFILAPPGIPVVLAPKSALILNLTLWDDSTQMKLNEEPHQITVLESFGAGSIIGTGYTQTREEQIQNLSQNAARAVERYMRENADWFGGVPEVLEEDATIISGDALAAAAAAQEIEAPVEVPVEPEEEVITVPVLLE